MKEQDNHEDSKKRAQKRKKWILSLILAAAAVLLTIVVRSQNLKSGETGDTEKATDSLTKPEADQANISSAEKDQMADEEEQELEEGRDLREESDDAYLEKLSSADISLEDAPNIIMILTDDMGLGDLSCYGSTLIDTPNIDALAENGIAFQNYFAANAVCSPSRAGLLTGRYPLRAHVATVFQPTGSKFTAGYSYEMPGISPDEITLADVLQSVGYDTACLGKWHLGDQEGYLPNDNGFDYFFGTYYSNDMEPYAYYRNAEIAMEAPVDQSTLTKVLTDEATQYIMEHQNRPFFLYYASPFPHYPENASDDFRGTSKAGLYGDCVQEIDWSVGQIMDTIEDLQLDDNTLVIFSSDNGPWFEGSTGGSRARKSSNFNGGINVPCIVWWPGHFRSGEVSDEMVSGMDFFPTILDLLDIELPDDRVIDGVSILPYLTGESETSGRNCLYLILGKTVNGMISGDYKYMAEQQSDMGVYYSYTQGPYLFNYVEDPTESYDLTTQYPELATEMQTALDTFATEMEENQRGWTDK